MWNRYFHGKNLKMEPTKKHWAKNTDVTWQTRIRCQFRTGRSQQENETGKLALFLCCLKNLVDRRAYIK